MNTTITKSLNFALYAQTIEQTALYPDIGDNLVYPGMGLIGEIGEVAEHLKRIMRDEKGELTPERAAKIKVELGDVLWYVMMIAKEAKLSLDRVLMWCAEESGRFEEKDSMLRSDIDPMSAAFQMACYAGKVSELIDDLTAPRTLPWVQVRRMQPDDQANFSSYLYDITRRISRIALWCGFTLGDVMQANVEKLMARRERATIQGTGDNR